MDQGREANVWYRTADSLNERQGFAYDIIRMYLGVGLFMRGVLFISNPEMLASFSEEGSSPWFWSMAVGHYVAAAHLCGGLLLAIGLFTRIAALVQVPLLFGAVFFVHLKGGLLAANQSLEFAALVLMMLCVYTVFGAGKWSCDYVFLRAPYAKPSSEPQTTRSRPDSHAPGPAE